MGISTWSILNAVNKPSANVRDGTLKMVVADHTGKLDENEGPNSIEEARVQHGNIKGCNNYSNNNGINSDKKNIITEEVIE